MVGILDYGMGNLSSVYNTLDYLGYDSIIIDKVELIDDEITHLIVPGVGSYAKAMKNLVDRGLDRGIINYVNSGRPYLGICLGMQLLSSYGYEDGKTSGLNLIEGEVVPFEIDFPVPHVGWNNIDCVRHHPVFDTHANHVDFYFVHSYYFNVENEKDILTMTDYGKKFCSSVSKKNILGVQYHPEKSQEPGLSLIEEFCEWNGKC